ncbi:MAG: hypothetical protein F4029_04425 [Gammaproteobacteria bacterium]|nr:hypothetical protein [Gammaproteobacteria bacterium]MYK45457.1 hypothetical protein [Gammaproteobacteria bacterium]
MIDAPTGVIEVEGEKEFVEAQLERLMPLIEACGFGQLVNATDAEDDSLGERGRSDEETDDLSQKDTKKPKRAVNRPPKGHSCADRIMELRKDGFFKERRTPAEIVDALGTKGWTHTNNQVSAAGGTMFKRGDIQRTKSGKGFAYFWDRD